MRFDQLISRKRNDEQRKQRAGDVLRKDEHEIDRPRYPQTEFEPVLSSHARELLAKRSNLIVDNHALCLVIVLRGGIGNLRGRDIELSLAQFHNRAKP